jgi:hypothetical protein
MNVERLPFVRKYQEILVQGREVRRQEAGQTWPGGS